MEWDAPNALISKPCIGIRSYAKLYTKRPRLSTYFFSAADLLTKKYSANRHIKKISATIAAHIIPPAKKPRRKQSDEILPVEAFFSDDPERSLRPEGEFFSVAKELSII